MENREELLDLLADLQHNLGKYIRLPMAMLGEGAGEEAYREALRCALLETRKGPSGVLSAQQIWDDFVKKAGGRLRGLSEFKVMVSAVKRALESEMYIDPGSPPMPMADIQEDFAAISDAIRHLMEGVENAP